MKLAARILSLLILAGLTTFFISCKDDPTPTKSEKDEQIEKLNGTWVVTDATFEGDEPDLNHDGMTITFSGVVGESTINYTVSDRPAGPSAWPANGQFTFVEGNVKTQLLRSDDVNVTYNVTDTSLSMEFTFNKAPYTAGRTGSVSGKWVFNFTKQ